MLRTINFDDEGKGGREGGREGRRVQNQVEVEASVGHFGLTGKT